MKNRALLTFATPLAIVLPLAAFAQNSLTPPYSVYGQWHAASRTTTTSTGTLSISIQPCHYSAGNVSGN